MVETADFTIKLAPNGRGHIYRDGEEVNNVRAFTIRGEVGNPTTIDIEYLVISVDVEAEQCEVQDVTAINSTSKRYTG